MEERLRDEPDPARGESAGLGIHRHEPRGVVHLLVRRVAHVDHFVNGIVQINFAFLGRGCFAGKVRHAADLQNVCHVRLVEPHRADGARFVRDRRLHDAHRAAQLCLD